MQNSEQPSDGRQPSAQLFDGQQSSVSLSGTVGELPDVYRGAAIPVGKKDEKAVDHKLPNAPGGPSSEAVDASSSNKLPKAPGGPSSAAVNASSPDDFPSHNQLGHEGKQDSHIQSDDEQKKLKEQLERNKNKLINLLKQYLWVLDSADQARIEFSVFAQQIIQGYESFNSSHNQFLKNSPEEEKSISTVRFEENAKFIPSSFSKKRQLGMAINSLLTILEVGYTQTLGSYNFIKLNFSERYLGELSAENLSMLSCSGGRSDLNVFAQQITQAYLLFKTLHNQFLSTIQPADIPVAGGAASRNLGTERKDISAAAEAKQRELLSSMKCELDLLLNNLAQYLNVLKLVNNEEESDNKSGTNSFFHPEANLNGDWDPRKSCRIEPTSLSLRSSIVKRLPDTSVLNGLNRYMSQHFSRFPQMHGRFLNAFDPRSTIGRVGREISIANHPNNSTSDIKDLKSDNIQPPASLEIPVTEMRAYLVRLQTSVTQYKTKVDQFLPDPQSNSAPAEYSGFLRPDGKPFTAEVPQLPALRTPAPGEISELEHLASAIIAESHKFQPLAASLTRAIEIAAANPTTLSTSPSTTWNERRTSFTADDPNNSFSSPPEPLT